MPKIGFRHSEESKKRITDALLQRVQPIACVHCGKHFRRDSPRRKFCSTICSNRAHVNVTRVISDEALARMSRLHSGDGNPAKRPGVGAKISAALTGKPNLKLRGQPHPWCAGANNLRWKGGITDKNVAIRKSAPAVAWRRAVFERDHYICQTCGQVGGKLEAHHVKSFAEHPELRFEISNGLTLCKQCHRATDNFLRRLKKHAS